MGAPSYYFHFQWPDAIAFFYIMLECLVTEMMVAIHRKAKLVWHSVSFHDCLLCSLILYTYRYILAWFFMYFLISIVNTSPNILSS